MKTVYRATEGPISVGEAKRLLKVHVVPETVVEVYVQVNAEGESVGDPVARTGVAPLAAQMLDNTFPARLTALGIAAFPAHSQFHEESPYRDTYLIEHDGFVRIAKTYDVDIRIGESTVEPLLAWRVQKPDRFSDNLAEPLYRFLAAKHAKGIAKPTARDVLEAWRDPAVRPSDVFDVMADRVRFYDTKGGDTEVDIRSLQRRIDRLTTA